MDKQAFYSRPFLAALAATLKFEGVYSADKIDPGGQTFCGISRVYHPYWLGWWRLDEWLAAGNDPAELNLSAPVRRFYWEQFWIKILGDDLAAISERAAVKVFDIAVNIDPADAVRILQRALNRLNNNGLYYDDLAVDGRIGPRTIGAVRTLLSQYPGGPELNELLLMNCLGGELYIHYTENPRHEYFRGWFARV